MSKKILILSVALVLFLPLASVFASDYTQTCGKTGSVSCAGSGDCAGNAECQTGTCTEACPSPKAHSTLGTDTCEISYDWDCTCNTTCQGGTATCDVAGDCSYSCDEGYHYSGGNCVVNPPVLITLPSNFVKNSLAKVSTLIGDFAPLLIIVIAIPLFFIIGKKIVALFKVR
jgi:hypothetical protein